MTKEKKITFWIQVSSCLIFILFILILSVVNVFAPKKTFSENENRVLADSPDASLNNIFFGDFDTQFENWFTDHFINRDSWIQTKARTRSLTGSIENNGVYFGKNNYLIQQFSSYNQKIVDNNIAYINEFAEANDIKINVLLVPGASLGESENLPSGAYNSDEQALLAYVKNGLSKQNFIDITGKIKNEENTYFRTDHHWNERGAEIGYQAICSEVLGKKPNTFTFTQVSDDFRGTMYSRSGAFWTKGDPLYQMTCDNPFDVRVTIDGKTYTSLFFEDHLSEKDKYPYYVDGNHGYVNIKTNVPGNKKAVIIKDSYSHILIPFLASEYSELDIFDLRYFRDSISPFVTDNTDTYVIYGAETFTSDTNLAILW